MLQLMDIKYFFFVKNINQMNWIYEPWPWYISGPMIALIMFLLLMVGKNFGMSANLRTMCTICGAGNKADFLSSIGKPKNGI